LTRTADIKIIWHNVYTVSLSDFMAQKNIPVMEKLQIKGDWADVKKKIQDAYPFLEENDLNYREGSEEQFLDNLQLKTGKRREDLINWINQLPMVSM
jgi:hypothetical protein